MPLPPSSLNTLPMRNLVGRRRHWDPSSYEVLAAAIPSQLDAGEWGWYPGDSGGQRSLACCSPWGHKELDVTWQLNSNRGWDRKQSPQHPAFPSIPAVLSPQEILDHLRNSLPPAPLPPLPVPLGPCFLCCTSSTYDSTRPGLCINSWLQNRSKSLTFSDFRPRDDIRKYNTLGTPSHLRQECLRGFRYWEKKSTPRTFTSRNMHQRFWKFSGLSFRTTNFSLLARAWKHGYLTRLPSWAQASLQPDPRKRHDRLKWHSDSLFCLWYFFGHKNAHIRMHNLPGVPGPAWTGSPVSTVKFSGIWQAGC